MQNRKLKFLKLGILSSATILAIPVVTSVSSYYAVNGPNNSEIIQIKLDEKTEKGIEEKTETFFSVKEAQDYILRHNMANMNQEVMVGNRKYLDKNNGMLNTNELYKYIADKEHIKPAYKMLNGKYTDSKNKALKTYIGRSHLVSQYYDFNGGYFDGTFAGLKQVKDSIRKRQLDKIIPFNKINLGDGNPLNINPFNSADKKALKERVLNIYKQNMKNSGTANPNSKVTATYMFPTSEYGNKKESYIGVEPNDYKKGLTTGDLVENSLNNQINNYINKIRFRLKVTLPDSSPYEFNVNGGIPTWYLKNENINSEETTDEKNGVKVDIYSKQIIISNISMAFLNNELNQKELSVFMDYGSFWDYFNETEHWDGWSKASKSAKLDPSHTLFGRKGFNITNTKPNALSGAGGFDIAVNQRGSVGQSATSAVFMREDTQELGTPSSLFQIKPKLSKIQSLLIQELKGNFVKNLNKHTDGSVKINSLNHFYLEHVTGTDKWVKQTFSNSSMIDDKGEKINSNQVFSSVNSSFDKIHSESLTQTPISSNKINVQSSISSKKDIHKILLFDGTPIMEIDDKNKEVQSDLISKIEVNKQHNNNNYIYEIFKDRNTSKQSGPWNSINKPTIVKDFEKYASFATSVYPRLEFAKFDQLKYSDEFRNIKPIIFYKGKNEARSENNTNLPQPNIQHIKLGKILSDNSKVVSINKLEEGLIFSSQDAIDDRKNQIASEYFQPPLVHVIYNDNDEVISEFQQNDSIIKFDDKETIKHNANAILSDYLRKDTSKVFVKVNGKWSKEPLNNELIMVYNITWKGNHYTFESFENIQKFIKEWIEATANTISEGDKYD